MFRFRIRSMNQRAASGLVKSTMPPVKLPKSTRIGIAGHVANEKTARFGFPKQLAFRVEVGICISQKRMPRAASSRNAARQVGITLRVPLPVPEQTAAEGGLPDAGPVLAPQAGNMDAGIDDPLQPLEAARAVLQPDDRARIGPRREVRAAGRNDPTARHQTVQDPRRAAPAQGQRPDFQFVKCWVPEIQRRIGGGFEMHGIAARREEARLRDSRSSTMPRPVRRPDRPAMSEVPGRARRPAPTPRAGTAAAQIQIRELLAGAPDMLVCLGKQADPDTIDRRSRCVENKRRVLLAAAERDRDHRRPGCGGAAIQPPAELRRHDRNVPQRLSARSGTRRSRSSRCASRPSARRGRRTGTVTRRAVPDQRAAGKGQNEAGGVLVGSASVPFRYAP